MQKNLLLAIIILGNLVYGFAQTGNTPINLGLSVTPHIGGLESDEQNAKNVGRGIVIDAHLIFDINDRLTLLVGPSFQTSEIANRANNWRWPDDNNNGEWQPGLSYEEYSVDYSSIGGTLALQWNLLKNNSRWNVSAASSLRYVIDYEDKITINESGNLWDPKEIEAEINPLQFFVNVGINYAIPIRDQAIFQIGPEIDFGLTEFLSSAPSTLLWSYKPTHPVFFGLQFMLRTL